jgi:hypothetical protein
VNGEVHLGERNRAVLCSLPELGEDGFLAPLVTAGKDALEPGVVRFDEPHGDVAGHAQVGFFGEVWTKYERGAP